MAPDAPTSLLALRDRRERAVQQLTDAFASDLITVDQFEDRLALVHAATTLAQLDDIVADLGPPSPGQPATALAPLVVERALTVPPTTVEAVFGNVERKGTWTVPAALEVRSIFGNVEIDFRHARFTAAVTEIDARVLFGNLEITVPPQLAVECEGSSILGNVENHGAGAVADPDRPLLRIRGRAVLGNIEIHTRLPRDGAGRPSTLLAAGSVIDKGPARR